MRDYKLPSLGSDMTSGVITAWHKKPGDVVNRGDIFVDVETDKGIIEVEAFESGIVDRLLVEEGARVPVGTVIALFRDNGDVTEHEAKPEPAPERREEHIQEPPVSPPGSRDTEPQTIMYASGPAPGEALHVPPHLRRQAPVAPAEETKRQQVTPRARKLASDLGVNIANVQPKRDGVVYATDIELAQAPLQTPERDRHAAMRRAIANLVTRSKREIPHYYVSTTVNMKRSLEWLEHVNAGATVENRILPAALSLRAIAKATRVVPELNGFWKETGAEPASDVHLGVAISLRGGGLVAPAIHHADQGTLSEFMLGFTDLVTRARAGKLRASEVLDATLTVTSIGDRGVEAVFPIIYPPQVAMVGVGKILRRPWNVDERVELCPIVQVTLAADHRVTDGHRGALYLEAIDHLLQEPDRL